MAGEIETAIMSSSLCENGGFLQLRKSKPFIANVPRKPNTMGSLYNLRRQQEAERSDDSEYSDIGYPSLPRPKTILSLSRGSVPRSLSRVGTSTVPVWVKKTPRRGESLIPLPSAAIAAVADATSPAPSPAVQVQVKLHSLVKQTKRKSLNGISDRAVVSEVAEVANGRKPPSGGGGIMMNRVKTKRVQGTASAEPPEEGQQQKPKKTWKTPKSLTFSFGSNSDRKRRALGFIGKKGPPSPPTPDSPILLSRKPGSLPSGSDVTDCKEVPIHPNSNGRPQSRSYKDLLVSSPRGKHRPPPLTNLSSPVSRFYCGMENSPRGDRSPAFNSLSGSSSRPDSCESLPLSNGKSATLPSSNRRYSPNVLRASSRHRISVTSKERKLSDPLLSTPLDAPSPDDSPGLQGRGLKKRYSFCVRPSRRNLAPEQGWVSGMAPI